MGEFVSEAERLVWSHIRQAGKQRKQREQRELALTDSLDVHVPVEGDAALRGAALGLLLPLLGLHQRFVAQRGELQQLPRPVAPRLVVRPVTL